MISRFVEWAAHAEGSTRSIALIRIGLVFLLWSRWAFEVSPFFAPSLLRVVLAAVFAVSTTLMLIGLWTRVAVPATAAVIGAMYVHGTLSPYPSSWQAHHAYLLVAGVAYCALTPSERSYSVDRWLAIRRARRLGEPLPPERGNLLGLRLIALQLATIYFWGALDKTHPGYFNGARIEQVLMAKYTGSDYPSWPGFHQAAVLLGASTVLLEYSLAFGLFVSRARRLLLPLGAFFHGTLYFVTPVSTFSTTMILLYLAYLDPDDVHQMLDELQSAD